MNFRKKAWVFGGRPPNGRHAATGGGRRQAVRWQGPGRRLQVNDQAEAVRRRALLDRRELSRLAAR
eukprot:3980440-Prymnesium_polylepis.1